MHLIVFDQFWPILAKPRFWMDFSVFIGNTLKQKLSNLQTQIWIFLPVPNPRLGLSFGWLLVFHPIDSSFVVILVPNLGLQVAQFLFQSISNENAEIHPKPGFGQNWSKSRQNWRFLSSHKIGQKRYKNLISSQDGHKGPQFA